MNMMLLRMFNWYILRKLVFIENDTYCMFLLTVNFFKVCPVEGVVKSSKELVEHFCLKKVWPYKVALNFLPFCFLYI